MGLDDPGFESKQGEEIFLFSKKCRPALEHTQPVPYFILRRKVVGAWM
jgi:hypothetical protein